VRHPVEVDGGLVLDGDGLSGRVERIFRVSYRTVTYIEKKRTGK
jgi:hypothetical protein